MCAALYKGKKSGSKRGQKVYVQSLFQFGEDPASNSQDAKLLRTEQRALRKDVKSASKGTVQVPKIKHLDPQPSAISSPSEDKPTAPSLPEPTKEAVTTPAPPISEPVSPSTPPIDEQALRQEIDAKLADYDAQRRQDIDRELSDYRMQEEQALRDEQDRLFDTAKKEGYEEGRSEALAELADLGDDLKKAISELAQKGQASFEASKKDFLTLSLAIAEQILSKQLAEDEAAQYTLIEDALRRITDKDRVIIRVRKEDVPTVQKYRSRLLDDLDDIKNLDVQEDPRIKSGGCIIETRLGFVDATIETQLESIQKAIYDTYQDEIGDTVDAGASEALTPPSGADPAVDEDAPSDNGDTAEDALNEDDDIFSGFDDEDDDGLGALSFGD